MASFLTSFSTDGVFVPESVFNNNYRSLIFSIFSEIFASVDHPQISNSSICGRVLHSFIRSDYSSTKRQKRTLDQTPPMLLYRASVGREVALGTKNDTFIRFHLLVPQILIVFLEFQSIEGSCYGLILVTMIQRLFVEDSMQSKRHNSPVIFITNFISSHMYTQRTRRDSSNPRLYEHGI